MKPIHCQTVTINGRTFEQRYVRCRKPTCWCMRDHDDSYEGRPGHGPYWYEIISNVLLPYRVDGQQRFVTKKRYIGTELRLESQPQIKARKEKAL